MARIRTVKPEMWTDPAFVECSSNARLLFVAGLNFASDYGVLPDNALQLKMQCFPGDSFEVEPLISELVAADLWQRVYAPDGTKVLLIRSFAQHQRVDRPTASRWGDPADWDEIRRVIDEDSSNDRRTLDLEGREGKEVTPTPKDQRGFDEFWNTYPRKVGKSKAGTAWRNLTNTDRRAATDALPSHVASWRGKDKQFIPHPATWLQQRRWEDEIATEPTTNVRRNGINIAPGVDL